MKALAAALSTRDLSHYESLVADASIELADVIGGGAWSFEFSADPYTTANKANLWKNEMRANTRASLEAAGKGEAEFGDWLGDIHFTSVAIYSQLLFSDGYQRNKNLRTQVSLLPTPTMTDTPTRTETGEP
jgi:5-methylcytosine-specific restriction protein B